MPRWPAAAVCKDEYTAAFFRLVAHPSRRVLRRLACNPRTPLMWKGKNQGAGRGLEFHQDQISTGGWPLRKHSRDSGKRPIPGQLLSTHTHAHIGVGMALGAAMRTAIASI